ncbi:MAG TPA: hypothetical protein VJ843_02970 [Candidatus Saccharimonadales bacterium]|nr:hypothetical protein [Candidatus Saccharimonadales bacterium]
MNQAKRLELAQQALTHMDKHLAGSPWSKWKLEEEFDGTYFWKRRRQQTAEQLLTTIFHLVVPPMTQNREAPVEPIVLDSKEGSVHQRITCTQEEWSTNDRQRRRFWRAQNTMGELSLRKHVLRAASEVVHMPDLQYRELSAEELQLYEPYGGSREAVVWSKDHNNMKLEAKHRTEVEGRRSGGLWVSASGLGSWYSGNKELEDYYRLTQVDIDASTIPEKLHAAVEYWIVPQLQD